MARSPTLPFFCIPGLVAILYTTFSLIAHSPAFAQEPSKTDKSQQRSFLSLRDERDTLEREIRDAEKSLETLTTQQYWLREEANAQKDLAESLKDKKTERVAQLKRRIAEVRENASTAV